MRVDDEGCEGIVSLFIDVVFDHGKKVESGEDWVREVDIIIEVECLVVVTVNRVSSCDDTASCLKTCDNTSL